MEKIKSSLFLLFLCLIGFYSNYSFASAANDVNTGVSDGTSYVNTGASDATSYASTPNYSSIANDINNSATQSQVNAGSVSYGNVGLSFYFVNPFPNPAACFKQSWSVSTPSETTIFNPLISVNYNFIIACAGFNYTTTLNAYGQCEFLGLVRVCARITQAGQYGSNTHNVTPSNPGSSYLICAFEDPMAPFDLVDPNPGSMPYQKMTSAQSTPSGNDLVALGAALVVLGAIVPGLGLTAMVAGAALMVAGGLMDLVALITSYVNYTVVANHGCVAVPLAPYPQPFASPIPGYVPAASVISICAYSPDYNNTTSTFTSMGLSSTANYSAFTNVQISSSAAPCEISYTNGTPVYSTYLNPLVRLYFNNPIPISSSNTGAYINTSPSYVNDTYITTNGIYSNPADLWLNSYNLVNVCQNQTSPQPCFQFPSGTTTGGPYRAFYSNGSSPNSFDQTLANQQSLSFGGINNSAFIDFAPGNTVTIVDPVGNSRSFYATISLDQMIYVTETTDPQNVISTGSVPRPTAFPSEIGN